jgi:hypothetical protein
MRVPVFIDTNVLITPLTGSTEKNMWPPEPGRAES